MNMQSNRPHDSFSAAGVTFAKPAELTPRLASFGAVEVVRLGSPSHRMELNLMVGPLMDVVKIATSTKISFHPPEGGGLTEEAARTVGNLFLSALEADSVLSTRAEVKTFLDEGGTTPHGYPYAVKGFTCMPDNSVAQCAVMIFRPDRPTVAVVAYRGNVQHQEEMEGWRGEIVGSLVFD